MSQIPAFDPTDTALRTTSPNGFSSLDSADFIRIMFTELANQDPFQPSDSSALLDQMNSIRSIESNIDLMDRLDTLVFENKLSSASSLIGKYVQGLHDQGFRVAGNVDTVLRQGDEIALQLDSGWLLRIDSIEIIQEAHPAQPAPTP
jgi:flagellar basal-body rod modification protein FlgD